MQMALKATGLPTKRAVVEEGLKLLLRLHGQERLRQLRGRVDWEGNLDELRRSRFEEA